MSLEAAEATALSFGALSAGLPGAQRPACSSMVRDMLRPMLKQWLDDNLPPIVERMVRDEIQRVARGRESTAPPVAHASTLQTAPTPL